MTAPYLAPPHSRHAPCPPDPPSRGPPRPQRALPESARRLNIAKTAKIAPRRGPFRISEVPSSPRLPRPRPRRLPLSPMGERGLGGEGSFQHPRSPAPPAPPSHDPMKGATRNTTSVAGPGGRLTPGRTRRKLPALARPAERSRAHAPQQEDEHADPRAKRPDHADWPRHARWRPHAPLLAARGPRRRVTARRRAAARAAVRRRSRPFPR